MSIAQISHYAVLNLELAEAAFEALKDKWGKDYPGAIKVWENNFNHVRQLFNYPSDIRRVMYTTNAIESVNSSLRKVTKKGFFGRMKTECFYNHSIEELSLDELKTYLSNYIQWYNNDRIKNTLGGLSPVQYRLRFG